MTSNSPSDVKQRILSLSDQSTSLETKKKNVEYLLKSSVSNDDFTMIVKETNGILVLTTLFKSVNDFDLKSKITTLLLFISLNGHGGASTEKLMNDVNISSLINLFVDKDFSVFIQAFDGLQVLGSNSSKQVGSPSKSSISFTLPAANHFLENISALIDPSSKLLSDSQKVEILGNFTRFVLTGVMSQAADEAAKDPNSELGKGFSLAYGRFVKTLESCHKGDFSNLDIFVAQIIQLVKDGKLISSLPSGLSDHLAIVNKWLGGSKKFVLIYKATKDGFAGATFHEKCDNKGPTVVIFTSSEDFVFGGFAAVSWQTKNNYIPDSSNQSFLFSLKNPRNEQPTKFGCSNGQFALYGYTGYGPTFSGSHDIYCSNNSNANSNSYTNLGAHSGVYSNTTGLNGQTVFTGKYNFTAKEIEVFQVQ